MSRVKNSVFNLSFSILGQIANIIAKFLVRTVFVYILGNEYLGLNGLFTNILSILSLSELGVGTAIVFSLYKPIAENDEEQIAKIMLVFRKAYIIIGLTVLLAGISLSPFLDFFITDMPNIPNMQIIYILYVINSGISYFLSYKATFISANQKNYIVTNNRYIFIVIFSALQCVLLGLTHNYIIFLILQILCTLFTNISISAIADKKYPVLKIKNAGVLDDDTKHIIKNNVSVNVMHRIGGIIVFSTDNILLSKMFDLSIVGIYSNYSLLVSTVEGVIDQFFHAITASVGNLRVSADKNHQVEIYHIIYFINFWLYSVCAVCFIILFEPFVLLWLGQEYVMDIYCVAFIVLNFYLKGLRKTNQIFNSAYGLSPKYKYMPVPESVINIAASIILGRHLGPMGIFIGTTISSVSTCVWIEPMVLFKFGFESRITPLAKKYIEYMGVTLFTIVITFFATGFVMFDGWIGLIIELLICLIIPNFIIALIYCRTNEFKYVKNLFFEIFGKKFMKNIRKS